MHDELECATSSRRMDSWCKSCLAVLLEQVTLSAIDAFGLPDTWDTRGLAAKFLDGLRARGWQPALNMDVPLRPFR